MTGNPNLAAIGALLGDPTRSLILELLYDGRAWTATELARAAGITPQTASSHLRKLVDGALLTVDAQGRHRYFRLAGTDVADALEAMKVLATRRNDRPGLHRVHDDPLSKARTCYDHVAGQLGVAIADSLTRHGYCVEGHDSYDLSATGEALLEKLKIDVEQVRRQRRSFARKCLDWSERRYHLGGALGAALTDCFFEQRWLQRHRGSRAVTITATGKRNFKKFGLI
jgi:DNA-binding transcriptional ArsR family regulator